MLEPNPAGVNVSTREMPEIPKIPSLRWLKDCHGRHFSMRCFRVSKFETKAHESRKRCVFAVRKRWSLSGRNLRGWISHPPQRRLQRRRGSESLTLWKGARQRRCAHPSSKMDPRRAAKSLRSVEQSGNRFARMQLSCQQNPQSAAIFWSIKVATKITQVTNVDPFWEPFYNSITKLKSRNLGSTFLSILLSKLGVVKNGVQKGGFLTNASKFQKSQQKLMNLSGMGGQMNTTHTES